MKVSLVGCHFFLSFSLRFLKSAAEAQVVHVRVNKCCFFHTLDILKVTVDSDVMPWINGPMLTLHIQYLGFPIKSQLENYILILKL